MSAGDSRRFRDRSRDRAGEQEGPAAAGEPGLEGEDQAGEKAAGSAETSTGEQPESAAPRPGRRKFIPPATLLAQVEDRLRQKHVKWQSDGANPFSEAPPEDPAMQALWSARRAVLDLDRDFELRRARLEGDYKLQLGHASQRLSSAEERVAAGQKRLWDQAERAAREAGISPSEIMDMIRQRAERKQPG